MSSREKWLLSLIEEEMLSEKPLEEDVATTVRPKSKIQELTKEFYQRLKNAESADEFDKFYEEQLGRYSQVNRFSTFIVKVAEKLDLKVDYPYWEKDFQKVLFKITERTLEESDALSAIHDLINDKYPNLVADVDVDVSSEGVNREYTEYVNQEMQKIKEQLKNGKGKKYLDKIQKIEQAEQTEIEELASELNRIVILGRETWELMLYTVMSPYAPSININNIRERPNLHFLFVGDVSTAKSKADKIIERIAPKSFKISKSTEASFEGVSKKESIDNGIIDIANQGILIIPEFQKAFEQFAILREVMDCGTITIVKGGVIKPVNVNISFFAGCNPRDDFFQNERNLRDQISFSDGILSRIDILMALMASKEKNELLLEQINIFTTEQPKITLEAIHERLKTLSTGMIRLVTDIVLEPHQKRMIKKSFLTYNQQLQNRPLLVLRDLDTLCRLVNVITATNFPKRELSNGQVKAKDADILKAIELWEEIIAQRKILYTAKHRLIFTLKDKVMMEIVKNGNEISQVELKNRVVQERLCSNRTVERKITQLVNEGKIVKIGKRNAMLKVACEVKK